MGFGGADGDGIIRAGEEVEAGDPFCGAPGLDGGGFPLFLAPAKRERALFSLLRYYGSFVQEFAFHLADILDAYDRTDW